MAKLSKHAKERLIERFNLLPSDIELVGNLFNQRQQYKVVSFSLEREIREIKYKGHIIQGVIVNGSIKTCHWDTFEADDELDEVDTLLQHNGQLLMDVQRLNKKVRRYQKIFEKLKTRNIFYGINYIRKLKKGWEDRDEETVA